MKARQAANAEQTGSSTVDLTLCSLKKTYKLTMMVTSQLRTAEYSSLVHLGPIAPWKRLPV